MPSQATAAESTIIMERNEGATATAAARRTDGKSFIMIWWMKETALEILWAGLANRGCEIDFGDEHRTCFSLVESVKSIRHGIKIDSCVTFSITHIKAHTEKVLCAQANCK